MVELAVAVGIAVTFLVRWRLSGETLARFICVPITVGYSKLWHRCTAGPSPLPLSGPAILVSNHTCSADPMFLQSGSRRVFCYLTAEEHYLGSPFLRFFLDALCCVPVSRTGHDAGALLRAVKRLEEGRLMVVFPEGNLSGVAKNRLRRGKHGVALLALRTRAPVYPAYIADGPRTRKLLLSWLWPPPGRVRVTYGPPIDLSAYYGRKRTRGLYEEVTEHIMRHVEALKPRRR
jgi:1-acyl-sn-glycerol-3-phosphate acyltransferase